MNIFVIALRRLIAVLCAALFLVGAVWNLFCTPPQSTEEGSAVIAQPVIEDVDAVFVPNFSTEETNGAVQTEQQQLDNRIAALRIDRDTGWQQLYHMTEQLHTTEQQQLLQQYAQLQYKEQRLELLLSAKGLDPCLVILEPQQANVIVPDAVLQNQYEKLYDLILRNTDYTQTQIVLIPLYVASDRQ